MQVNFPEPDPVKADRRRVRRRSALPSDAACAVCGITDPDVLEVNHALGFAASEASTVVLCRNHHAGVTGRQHDFQALPPPGRDQPCDSLLELIARALRSLATLVMTLPAALLAMADALFRLSARLDRELPGWRGWPETEWTVQ